MRRPRGLRPDIPGVAQHGSDRSFRAPPPRGPNPEAGLAPFFQSLEFDPAFPMALGSILFLILGPVLGFEV